MKTNEIEPPWVWRPKFPPSDFFWRDAGDPWLNYVWRPYWHNLPDEEKEGYLHRWNVPDEWRFFSLDINEKWNEELAEIDRQFPSQEIETSSGLNKSRIYGILLSIAIVLIGLLAAYINIQ